MFSLFSIVHTVITSQLRHNLFKLLELKRKSTKKVEFVTLHVFECESCLEKDNLPFRSIANFIWRMINGTNVLFPSPEMKLHTAGTVHNLLPWTSQHVIGTTKRKNSRQIADQLTWMQPIQFRQMLGRTQEAGRRWRANFFECFHLFIGNNLRAQQIVRKIWRRIERFNKKFPKGWRLRLIVYSLKTYRMELEFRQFAIINIFQPFRAGVYGWSL